MNTSDFCNLFYTANNIPITYFEDENIVCNAGFPNFLSPNILVFQELLQQDLPLAISSSVDNGYYGLIRNPNQINGYFLIGPAFSTHLSDDSIRVFMHSENVDFTKLENTKTFIHALPLFTYYRFINILSFLHLLLFGSIIPPEQIYHIDTDSSTEPIAQKVAIHSFDARESNVLHSTYMLEQQLLSLVKSGNVEKIEDFLLNTVANLPLTEGLVGYTPIRQAKNIFLSTVAIVGKYAAIPAGMNIELSYQLIDQYSIECERLQTVDSVTALQYNMFIDFTKRIAEIKIPEGLSGEMYQCIQFVNQHINEPISVLDVANHIGRSRAYTLAHFKEELGFNLGEYISHTRILEAKNLLKYTDKSLSEISNYLCYSSQSYFQNTFKKATGITPLAYRKKGL